MYKNAHGGITVFTFFDSRGKSVGEKCPVKIRVRYKRDRKDYPTGKKLTADEWVKLSNSTGKSKLKEDIQDSFNIIDDIVKSLHRENIFSYDALNMRLSKGSSDFLNTAFIAKMDALIKDDAIGNMLNYQSAARSVESFAGDKIYFSDISVEWLTRYQKHLLSAGKSFTTVSMYCRCIRALFNDAIQAGTIKENQYPFGKGKNKFTIPKGEGRKIALNMQQIKAVIQFDDGNETTRRYRDLFIFSYLCNGINFGDMLQLKFHNIVGDEICFYRQKTIRTSNVKKEIQAIVTPLMQSIIGRWGNPDRNPDCFIFPYLTGNEDPYKKKMIIHDVIRRTNKRLKVIGEAIGVEGLSTYAARHSYASVLKRSGAPIAFISESLGHSNLKTTESYLASFEKDERRKNAALLTNFE